MALDSHYPPEGTIVDLVFFWMILATIAIISTNRKLRALTRKVEQLSRTENHVCPSCGSLAGQGRFCGSGLEQAVAAK
jgi:hypothetical protein